MDSRLQAVQGDWLRTCCWCLVNSRDWWLIAHTFLCINNFQIHKLSWLCMGQKGFIFLFFFQFKHHISHISNHGRSCKGKYFIIWLREKLTLVSRTPAFIQISKSKSIGSFHFWWTVILSHNNLNLLSRYHLKSFEGFWGYENPKFSLDFTSFLFLLRVVGFFLKNLFSFFT